MGNHSKIFILLFMLSAFSYTKGVPAGTQIVNVAQLDYAVDGINYTTTSNTITDTVDQVIDLDIVCQTSTNTLVQTGETQRALTFRLSNIGNGTDSFSLIPDTNATTPEVDNRLIYLDNGDGVFNTSDTQISDINLTADANVTLFFVSDIPSAASWISSSNGIEARSTTGGSGTPGTSYTLDNYFAVDGFKGGVDSDLCTYELHRLELNLEKSATLSSTELYTGTIIHYKIVASVEGVGTLSAVVIKDIIPSGTSYVPNTLELDGNLLSDATHITSNVVTVPVGDMIQTSTSQPTHTLEFDVKVD